MNLNIELEKISKQLIGNDVEFFKRVWSSDLTKYQTRLKKIDFFGKEKVLDAGFGMGQWAIKLSEINNAVYGIEYSDIRVKVVNELFSSMNVLNAKLIQGSIEDLPYKDNDFDAVFCYSVLFCTDYKKTLQEFYRVLKPNGKLYFSANGLGWTLYCLVEEHNKSKSYDPRMHAIDHINSTINYLETGKFTSGYQVILNRDSLLNTLQAIGFKHTQMDHEGMISVDSQKENLSFYPIKEYLGQDFIFEVLTTK